MNASPKPDDKDYYSSDFYLTNYRRRIGKIQRLQGDKSSVSKLKQYYKTHPDVWVNDWAMTYDPRNVGTEKPALMPFVLYPRQREFILWLYDHAILSKRHGVVDKCRDSGATWLACAFSVWMILHYPGVAIGFGSRKYELVEKKGSPDCIFEKIRQILNNLPWFMLPNLELKNGLIINHDNGSTISGEGGDNVGRGGRTTLYFPDEFAFFEHAEAISAALSQNTNVEIDISTHNGTNTLYYTRTQSYPEEDIFVFDWYHTPTHDEEWRRKQEERAQRDGTMWIYEQEVMRNPGGSVPGILIPQKYVRAAIDSHIKLGIDVSGVRLMAMDVANEGGDLNCLVERHGILVKSCESWPEGTTTENSRRAFSECITKGIDRLVYESTGVGAGVKGESKDLNIKRRSDGLPQIDCHGWSPSVEVIDKDKEYTKGKTNGDMFQNRNGQAAWGLRERFRKTYDCIENGADYNHDELISLDSSMPELQKLVNELSQPKLRDMSVTNGKIAVDKKPKGAKSPNRFDAVKIAFARIQNTVVNTGGYY